jgi:hypothetical protein
LTCTKSEECGSAKPTLTKTRQIKAALDQITAAQEQVDAHQATVSELNTRVVAEAGTAKELSAVKELMAAKDALASAQAARLTAHLRAESAKREASDARNAALEDFTATKEALDALGVVQRSVSAITLNAKVAQGTTSGDAASTHTTDIGNRDKKPKLSPSVSPSSSSRTSAIAASGNHVHPQVTTTLDDFLDRQD